ncbi:MAG: homoserine kinase [Neisseriaceae bacterium]|nr:homoserine kinase [Neisseriaceae bacterium]MBQ5429555.1 homoserine kinase [Neisseriaceae bacterium]
MSVYTTVSNEEMAQFLRQYGFDCSFSFEGVAGGITNSIYFVDIHTAPPQRFVLTIYEEVKSADLPFFLNLCSHLQQHGVACPAPLLQQNGHAFGVLCGKPAALISFLTGKIELNPNEKQCFEVGKTLAKMHQATLDFPLKYTSRRGENWRNECAKKLSGCLNDDDNTLLQQEMANLKNIPNDLPSGIIHADLFRDNVLLSDDEVSGFLDFDYACNGLFAYDLCVALNDWTRDDSSNRMLPEKYQAMLAGYESVRPLTVDEKTQMNNLHRAAALRFWLSRLVDFHFPPKGEITFTKNPNDFKDLILQFNKTETIK